MKPKVYHFSGVTYKDLSSAMFGRNLPLEMMVYSIVAKHSIKNPVFRGFNPSRLDYIIENGTDRSSDYISKYDPVKEDGIYAGPLNKAIEAAIKYYNDHGKACIAIYEGNKLTREDFYTYKPRPGATFKEALKAIVCFYK